MLYLNNANRSALNDIIMHGYYPTRTFFFIEAVVQEMLNLNDGVDLIDETCTKTGINHRKGIEGLECFKMVNVTKILMTE